MTSELISTKPYMLRAIHEWCVDNNLTPHLLVEVNSQTRVPVAYVKEGEIVLNLSYGATKDLHFDNEQITFSARFGGISQNLYVPITAVKGIFARENGQGMFFEIEPESLLASKVKKPSSMSSIKDAGKSTEDSQKISSKKPTLTIVK